MRYVFYLMYRYYLSLLFHIWLISSTEITDEKFKTENRTPLILSPVKKVYEFPIKASITTDQKQKFYFNKKDDGRYFCPIENETSEGNVDQEGDEKRVESPDELKYQNCLYEKQFKTGEEKLCKSEVKPVIVEVENSAGNEICGLTGFLYHVAYKVCVNKSAIKQAFNKLTFSNDTASKEIHHVFTYEVCYDHSKGRVLYTIHKIKSPFIIRNVVLEEERALLAFSKNYSTETYGITNLKNLGNILNAYNRQTNIENKQILQVLVPTYDFAWGNLMKTTFHTINYDLQHESKTQIWSAINFYVRDRLIKIFDEIGEVRIFTGTFGEQTDGKKKLYLGNDQNAAITIPKIWWKLIYSAITQKGSVIIMHNDNDSKKICNHEETACDVTKWKNQKLKKEDFEYVYCCSLSSASESIPLMKHMLINLQNDLLEMDSYE